MQTFTIGLGRYWCIRALGRSPLVRATDRIEAVAVMLAIVVALIAVPIAGAIGTSVHDTRARIYAEQAQTRHIVTAIATTNSTALATNSGFSMVRVKWSAPGGEHAATLIRDKPIKAGQPVDIWVDQAGAYADSPLAPGRAGFDAVVAAVLAWCAVVGVMAGLTQGLRWRLDRRRYAQWDTEISTLANGNDGRTNLQP